VLEGTLSQKCGDVKGKGHNGHCGAMKGEASARFWGLIDEAIRKSLFAPDRRGICEEF